MIDDELARRTTLPPKEIVLELSMFEKPSDEPTSSDLLAIFMWASQYDDVLLILSEWWRNFLLNQSSLISLMIQAIKKESHVSVWFFMLYRLAKFRWITEKSSASLILAADNDIKLSELKVKRKEKHTLCVEGIPMGKTKMLRASRICGSRRNTYREECDFFKILFQTLKTELPQLASRVPMVNLLSTRHLATFFPMAYLWAVYDCMDEGYVQEHSPITAWMYQFLSKGEKSPVYEVIYQLGRIMERNNRLIKTPWRIVVFEAPPCNRPEERLLNEYLKGLIEDFSFYLVDVKYLHFLKMFDRSVYDELNGENKFKIGFKRRPHVETSRELFNLSRGDCETGSGDVKKRPFLDKRRKRRRNHPFRRV